MRTRHVTALLAVTALLIAPAVAQKGKSSAPLFSNELPLWGIGAYTNIAVSGTGFGAVPGVSGSYGDMQAGLHFGAVEGEVQVAASADWLVFNNPVAKLPLSWFAGPGVYLAAGSDFADYSEFGAGLRVVAGVRTMAVNRVEAYASAVPSVGVRSSAGVASLNWSVGLELGARYAIPRKKGIALKVTRPAGDWSPDGDGFNDRLGIVPRVTGEYPIGTWKFEVKSPSGQSFYTRVVNGPVPSVIEWDGVGKAGDKVASMCDYKYSLTVTDRMGATASYSDGVIPVGIVLRKSGGNYVLDLTGFVFAPDSPKLATDAASAKENARLLASLKSCLDTLKQYRVTIVGHAVNVSGTAKEEASLSELSTGRAETIKAELKKLGYDIAGVTTVGKGGTQPVVPHTDTENRWKNRRVEFILTPKGATK